MRPVANTRGSRHDAIGFDEACLIFATGREATTPEILTRAATLFAEDVMPAFQTSIE